MDFIPGILSGVSTLILFCILGGTLMKVLQIGNDVKELKELMQKRSAPAVAQAYVPPAPVAAPPALPGSNSAPISPEDLVRAVHAQGYDAIITEAEILPPRP